ncbi:MAG: hypothetical protein Q8P40_13155 [Nitrospirota bacterium]|nr:hypothetical protein [Nitrospirota bacterium]
MYKGFKEADTHTKTICNHCGIRTGYAEMPCKVSGCSGTLKKIERPVYRIGVYPGKGVDMDEDFEEWSDDTLEARYDLVKEFDLTRWWTTALHSSNICWITSESLRRSYHARER